MESTTAASNEEAKAEAAAEVEVEQPAGERDPAEPNENQPVALEPESEPVPEAESEPNPLEREGTEEEEGPASPEAGEELQEQEQKQESSIIEMEVDDSNTGDTITSNPEIDLGSAAAAATAVIVEEEQEGEKIEDDEEIMIVATQSMAKVEVSPTPKSPEDKPASDEKVEDVQEGEQQDALGQKDEETVEDAPATPADTPTSPVGVGTDEPENKVEEQAPAEPEPEKEIILVEPMDTGEEADGSAASSVVNSEVLQPEPTTAVLEGDVSASEVEQDLMEPTEPESDSALENEPDPDPDSEFLQEESSMQSLPEDIVETDKENNGAEAEGDLILVGDDENDDDETYLEITRRRISQDREGNCYCGKDRNFNIPELLCASCYRWFHESCISYQLGKLVPFSTNYVFTCKNCSPTGLECFRRNQAQFPQMCITVLANLMQAAVKDGTNMKLFSKDRDIIPFFEIHWEALTTQQRRSTMSWHSTVTKTLMKEPEFVCQEIPDDQFSPYYGLAAEDLTQIRPNYDAMIKAGQLKITDSRNCASAKRGAKRRTVDSNNGGQSTLAKKPRGGDLYGPKPSIGHGYPTEHPFNKDSYRYILAEPDPNAPFRQEFDESNEWSGKPIHGWLCRVVNPPSVLLALHDRAPQLRVSDDRLSVTGERGYCMIRATHGITRGSWYFEAKITDMPEGSATRIGFCQQFGNLQGPLGFDRYGYSWRSRYGTTFHEARGKSYAKGGYGLDDVLGFLIVLPEDKSVPSVPTSFKDRPLVKVKSHLYYEDKDDPKELDKRDLRQGAKIICFKNGVCQGVAFEDIYCGTYYPAISVYKSITVRVNFGPDFEAPPTDHEYHGMCERAEDSVIEQTMADLLYLTENDGGLRLDNAVPMPL